MGSQPQNKAVPHHQDAPLKDAMGHGHPLRPDLYQFVRLERGPGDMRKLMVAHPLVCIEIEDLNHCRLIHDAIDDAVDSLEQAIGDGNWRDVIYCHAERYRLKAFCEYAHRLSDHQYWSILGDLYREYQAGETLVDAFPQVLIFHQLLQSRRPYRELLMDDADRQLFAQLPMSFTVYRGFARGDGSGISWTPDRRVGVWFAHLECSRSDGKCVPQVARAVVTDKSNAYAFFSKETEVLVPMDSLSDLVIEEATNESAAHPSEYKFDFHGWLSETSRQHA